MALAAPYDFGILTNAKPPRCVVYDIDTGAEMATWAGTSQIAQDSCVAYCDALNAEGDAAVIAAANLSPSALVEAARNAVDLDDDE